MTIKRVSVLIITLFIVFDSSVLFAQDSSQPTEVEYIHSMGQPSRYEFSWGPMFVIDQQGDNSQFGGQVYANLYRHFFSHPSCGLGLASVL